MKGVVHLVYGGPKTRVVEVNLANQNIKNAIRVFRKPGETFRGVIGHFPGELTPKRAAEILLMRQNLDIGEIFAFSPENALFPKEKIFTVGAGTYKRLGGDEGNPFHDVTLPREFSLFRLSINFAMKFAGIDLVDEILSRKQVLVDEYIKLSAMSQEQIDDKYAREGFPRGTYTKEGDTIFTNLLGPSDIGMITDVSIHDILSLLEVINPALVAENVRLRLPAEAVIEVLMTHRTYQGERKGLKSIQTASLYNADGVNVEEFDIELAIDKIQDSNKYVMRDDSAHRSYSGLNQRVSYAAPVLEVVPLS